MTQPKLFSIFIAVFFLLVFFSALSQADNLRPWDNPIFCPNCNSSRVAYILYGEPYIDENLQCALDSHRVILGGCLVTSESKRWECLDCGHSWGKVNDTSPVKKGHETSR